MAARFPSGAAFGSSRPASLLATRLKRIIIPSCRKRFGSKWAFPRLQGAETLEEAAVRSAFAAFIELIIRDPIPAGNADPESRRHLHALRAWNLSPKLFDESVGVGGYI